MAVAAGSAVLLPSLPGLEAHQVPGVPAPSTTVAPPIEVEGPGSGQASRVRVFHPATPATTLAEIEAGPAGSAIRVLGAPVFTGPATPGLITIQGDLAKGEKVNFTLTVAGATRWLQVDRSQSPALITSSESAAVQAPVALRGDPANPSEIVVFDANGQPVFSYKTNPNGTATINASGMATRHVAQNLVLVSGSPFGEALDVVTRDPDGNPLVKVSVPLATVRAALAAGGVPDSYLTVARNALPDMNAYKAANDGVRTIGAENLTGQHWLNANMQPHTVWVDVRKTQDLGPPVLLFDTKVPVPGAGVSAAMLRGKETATHVRYEGQAPAAWLGGLADGATVHFAIAYRSTLASLVTHQLVDDNDGTAYRYRMDKAGPLAPALQVAVPDASKPHVLQVSWAATDAGSGVASYKVEKGKVVGGQATWEMWANATTKASEQFTGAAGESWRFRVVAVDKVGNLGAENTTAAHDIPGAPGSGPTNRAPEVRLVRPVGGESFIGEASVRIAWTASDPDGTVPVINLYWSKDGGATWQSLPSPSGAEAGWDVSALPAGDAYRVKVEASDGSLSNQDASGKFRIDATGLATESSIGGPNAKGLGDEGPGAVVEEADPASQGGAAPSLAGNVVVMTALGVVLVAAAAGVALWKWRSRRGP